MIIFLTRMDAGKRGATGLEPGHLLEAIIREDQGELAKRFVGAATTSGPIREPEPFFSAQAASSNVLLSGVVLTLWEDADPDIPILKQARAEYAKLQ